MQSDYYDISNIYFDGINSLVVIHYWLGHWEQYSKAFKIFYGKYHIKRKPWNAHITLKFNNEIISLPHHTQTKDKL